MEDLDSMSRSDLMAFWSMYNKPGPRTAGKLFGCAPKGYIQAAQDCACYASYKASAIECRDAGDVTSTQFYKVICKHIYNQLPQYARW